MITWSFVLMPMQGHRMSFNTDSIGSTSSKSSTIHMNFT
jgi:hypothetical protein